MGSLSRYVLENSRNKSFRELVKLVDDLTNKTNIKHEIPSCLTVATIISAVYLSAGWRPLSSDYPSTFTICQESISSNCIVDTKIKVKDVFDQVVVGNFSKLGFEIHCSPKYKSPSVGLAVVKVNN